MNRLRHTLAATASLALLTALGCSSSSTTAAPLTPTASLSATSLTFASTSVGANSAAQSVTLSNTGSAPLNITQIALGGANPADFAETTTCGTTLAAGANCTISATFTPASVAGFFAAISITDNAANSPQSITLSGTGASAPTPAVSLSPTTLNFTDTAVGVTAAAQTVTLSNTGLGTLNISSISITGTNPTDFADTSACGSALAAGSSCAISVSFTPASSTEFSAHLSIADDATGSPQTVQLNGSGPEPNSCKAINITSPAQPTPTSNYAGHAFTGTVLAGATPLVGATVQVYAAGAAGNGSVPTPLLPLPLLTDANGAFSIPATFTCPLSNSVLYAVARGGTLGSISGPTNTGTVLATVLGACNSLTGSPSFVINEATTVATVWAMSQFLSPGANLGATSTNGSGILLAAAGMANLVNTSNGSTPGITFPSIGAAPSARINLLGNLLNACIVSPGATSTACTQLYADTTVSGVTPTNTFDAALNIARQPSANIAALYALAAGSSAYTPVPAAAPADWAIFVNYTGAGMNDPTGVSIDSVGNVWVASYFGAVSYFYNTGVPVYPSGIHGLGLCNSYAAAVNVSDILWVTDEPGSCGDSSVATVTNMGTSPAGIKAGGLNFPISIAFDPSNVAWVVNYGNSTVTQLSSTGTALSGPSGFNGISADGAAHFAFPTAVAVNSKCNAFIGNSDTVTRILADGSAYTDYEVGAGPSGIAVDSADNVWTANYYGDSIGLISPIGEVLSGAGFTGGGLDHPQSIAIDGAGTAWVANYRSTNPYDGLTELAGANTAHPGAILSPAAGFGVDAGMIESYSIAIDAAGNIWISNFATNTLTEFIGLAVPVKTPMLGPVRIP